MPFREKMLDIIAAAIEEQIKCSSSDALKAAGIAVETLVELPDSVLIRAIEIQQRATRIDAIGHQANQRLNCHMNHSAVMVAVIEDQGEPCR